MKIKELSSYKYKYTIYINIGQQIIVSNDENLQYFIKKHSKNTCMLEMKEIT